MGAHDRDCMCHICLPGNVLDSGEKVGNGTMSGINRHDVFLSADAKLEQVLGEMETMCLSGEKKSSDKRIIDLLTEAKKLVSLESKLIEYGLVM